MAAAPTERFQLFGFWRSLATYRVLIALRLKGLDWTEEVVDLLKGEQYGESLAARNSQQRLPVLILNDERSLAQSLAILEYLDEIHPEPALWPEDRYQRALARQFALISIADSHPVIVPRVRGYLAETFGADEAAIEAWGRHWMDQGLRAMEALLARPERPEGSFCYGNAPGIADVALTSHCAGAGYFNCPLVLMLACRRSWTAAWRCRRSAKRTRSRSRRRHARTARNLRPTLRGRAGRGAWPRRAGPRSAGLR